MNHLVSSRRIFPVCSTQMSCSSTFFQYFSLVSFVVMLAAEPFGFAAGFATVATGATGATGTGDRHKHRRQAPQAQLWSLRSPWLCTRQPKNIVRISSGDPVKIHRGSRKWPFDDDNNAVPRMVGKILAYMYLLHVLSWRDNAYP